MAINGQPTVYRVFDSEGSDLGLLSHPRADVDRGDVIALDDGSVALILARVSPPLHGSAKEHPLLQIAQYGGLRFELASE
mgnify:CR=1 FL=1